MMILQRSHLTFLALSALICSASAFTLHTSSSSSRTPATALGMAKRGRGSFQKETDADGFSGKKTTSGVRNDINWCPVNPPGQKLPDQVNQVGLLDTNLPTMKNSATNPTGAVAVVKSDNDQTYCFSSSCPSCQIPLTKAKVIESTAKTAPHPRLVCDFCKATYSLKDGSRLSGEDAVKEGGGILGGIVKNVFSAKDSGPLKMYKLGQKGKDLVIAVD
mmetsp:Transcript_21319/g.40511  ORF Transcript_21319/g.40511 Transcript_21319/m.40511 type:complete len:218 (-) Transcript_21319:125-778(-)